MRSIQPVFKGRGESTSAEIPDCFGSLSPFPSTYILLSPWRKQSVGVDLFLKVKEEFQAPKGTFQCPCSLEIENVHVQSKKIVLGWERAEGHWGAPTWGLPKTVSPFRSDSLQGLLVAGCVAH